MCSQYGAFGSLRVLAGWPVCRSGVLLWLHVAGVWAASSVMWAATGRWKAAGQADFGHPGARSADVAVPSADVVRIARSRWHVGMRTVKKVGVFEYDLLTDTYSTLILSYYTMYYKWRVTRVVPH